MTPGTRVLGVGLLLCMALSGCANLNRRYCEGPPEDPTGNVWVMVSMRYIYACPIKGGMKYTRSPCDIRKQYACRTPQYIEKKAKLESLKQSTLACILTDSCPTR